ncbi:MAG: cysteine desulfurase-like protein [Bacteroidota bacterium]
MEKNRLKLDFIRPFFPALRDGYVFMDNAGGSQTLRPVVDYMVDYMWSSNVQHGASYEVSQLSTNRVYEASQHVRAYLNASHVDEIVLGPSTSMLIRILSLGLVDLWEEGDEIIVTNTDHEANVSPWSDLEKRGITVKIWSYNPESLKLELDDLRQLMTDKTRLVAVTHASNVLGTINPIKTIAEEVHKAGALICVDGVAYAPHRLPDVKELDVDFYIFSWYKVYGPHYAVMYGRRELLSQMTGINHYFIQSSPYKFQPGNVNFELTYSLMGLFDYLAQVSEAHGGPSGRTREAYQYAFDLFAAHETELAQRLIDFLHSKSGISIIGVPNGNIDKRVSTISFVAEGRDSKAIVDKVDPYRIGIRYGDFYAKKLIEGLGIEAQNGVVRISMVHYNTMNELDRLIEILDGIL